MTHTASRVVLCVVGRKGAIFIEQLAEMGIKVGRVFSYDQSDDQSASFEKIKKIANDIGAEFLVERRPNFESCDVVFFVGWQFLVSTASTETLVVFHDSLLPKYRGFSPTVTALINGDTEIGITALCPTMHTDEGPIIAQLSQRISYPIKILTALDIQAMLMARTVSGIVGDAQRGAIAPVEQDHSAASYSLWRDEADYAIDWNRSATEIARMIDATGYPYAGARTSLDGTVLIVQDATPMPDLSFAIRSPGKVWRIDDGRPVVVCGQGLIRLDACIFENGETASFTRLRARFI